jgi:serine/threonine protein kinase
MKCLCKHLILEGQNVGYVQSERDILSQCQSNPFIIQLHYAFQNAERLFFLMEVARGGTLFDLLDNQAPRPFKQERIIFYTGQVTCAILFLHSKRIVRFILFLIK